MALAAALSLTPAIAQKSEDKDKQKDKKKNQTVTIVRTGDSEEKITVEVIGDKVTINGKPASEYKGGNVEISTGETGHVRFLRPSRNGMVNSGVLSTMEPGAPRALAMGGWGRNKAVLGVATEDTTGGARITSVTAGSAAEKAGLKAGDVITKVNEYNVADADDLPAAMAKFKPEDQVTVTYKRDGKEATANATLAKNEGHGNTFVMGDHDFNFNFDNGSQRVYNFSAKPRLGLQLQDLEEGDGVKVLDVNAETPAGKAGLQKDDVITSFNGKEVKNIDELRNSMKEVKQGDTVKITFRRGGATQNAEIKFPKPVKKASL